MFLYKVSTPDRLFWLISNLAGYIICMRSREIENVLYLQVEPSPLNKGDFRLAEMFMQMNYHQIGGVCPACKDLGEAHCGHLTFGAII